MNCLRLFCAGSLLFAAGCDHKPKMLPVYPVSGQVLYFDKPLEGALVIFQLEEGEKPAEMMMWPNGTTDKEGKFKLSSYSAGDGAPVGKYRVTITCPKKLPDPAKESSPAEDMKDRFAGKYSDPKNPKFNAEVKAEPNQVEPFKLD